MLAGPINSKNLTSVPLKMDYLQVMLLLLESRDSCQVTPEHWGEHRLLLEAPCQWVEASLAKIPKELATLRLGKDHTTYSEEHRLQRKGRVP